MEIKCFSAVATIIVLAEKGLRTLHKKVKNNSANFSGLGADVGSITNSSASPFSPV